MSNLINANNRPNMLLTLTYKYVIISIAEYL